MAGIKYMELSRQEQGWAGALRLGASVSLAATIECHRRPREQQKFIFLQFWRLQAPDQHLAGRVPGGPLLLAGAFSPGPHVVERSCSRPFFLSGHWSYRARAPPSWPHLAPSTCSQAPSPATATLGVRVSTEEFGEDTNIHSVTGALGPLRNWSLHGARGEGCCGYLSLCNKPPPMLVL